MSETPNNPSLAPAAGHVHLWDRWYPQDRTHTRRVCLDPTCREVEYRKETA